MTIPGHTLGHVAYHIGGQLFPGDTLFGSGCGRLFEGTPAQMQDALSRLRALPADTRVWCGHEYTLLNLRYAVEIDPDNQALRARHAAAEAQVRQAGFITQCTRDVHERLLEDQLNAGGAIGKAPAFRRHLDSTYKSARDFS